MGGASPAKRESLTSRDKQEEGRMDNESATTNCSDFPDKSGLNCGTPMCVGNTDRCYLRMPLFESFA